MEAMKIEVVDGTIEQPKNRVSKYQPILEKLKTIKNNKALKITLPKPEKFFHTGFRTFLSNSPLKGKKIGISRLDNTNRLWQVRYGLMRKQTAK